MSVIHLRQKGMSADFRVVALRHAESVNALNRNAGALEKLRCVGVGCRHVWRKSLALIEPVSLAEFADNCAPGGHLFKDELAHLANVFRERRSRLPIHFSERA